MRQSVSDLLCRVAQDAPHLIVYPAVVGASSASEKLDIEVKGDGKRNRKLASSALGVCNLSRMICVTCTVLS